MAIGKDIYQEITNQIIAQIEGGVMPWAQPWKGGQDFAGHGMPYNAATGRAYSGINVLLLWTAQLKGGYKSPAFVTFKQALDMGGNVRKGEKGTMAVFADRFVPKGEKDRAREAGEDARSVYFLKSFTVFNVEQCENLGGIKEPAKPDFSNIEPDALALIKATGARITIGGNKAFYMPSTDSITMPAPQSFPDPFDYIRTCFHEIGHWTKGPGRLERNLGRKSWGDEGYAREELVAEMCAAFVCAAMGIEPTLRHADYIGSWLKVLKNDNRAIVQAASMASKAADFILAFRANEVAEFDKVAA